MHGLAKPKNAFATLKRIFSYMHGFKAFMVLSVIGIILSSGAGIIGTNLLKPIIDNLDEAFESGIWAKTRFIQLVVSLAVVYAVGALSSLMYMRMMLKISTTTLMRIRNDLFCKMEKLPIRFFDKHTHGELMSLYTNDTDAIREMLSNSVAQFISSAITIVGVFASMLYFSWQLTILRCCYAFCNSKGYRICGFTQRQGLYCTAEGSWQS